tara:strand:- start:628 stop:1113 length:486 start_codon:yes stop_codon:yes gene_type:complete
MNYSRTVIYKIVCLDNNVLDCYVGHTTDFVNRKNVHKHDCNNEKTNHLNQYQIINANGGWDNWAMVEIEKFSCKDANEAKAREMYWYKELNANMNTSTPLFTNIEGITSSQIVGETKQETHKLKCAFRRNAIKDEMAFLREENKMLKQQLLELQNSIKDNK